VFSFKCLCLGLYLDHFCHSKLQPDLNIWWLKVWNNNKDISFILSKFSEPKFIKYKWILCGNIFWRVLIFNYSINIETESIIKTVWGFCVGMKKNFNNENLIVLAGKPFIISLLSETRLYQNYEGMERERQII